ncbi:Cytochrome P450 monooxygenase verL [Psilocybe cubensis]|uniref:Cytochrome P450 monooxygenase verL n=1 Tax=Psilocybe cubensis TaxID=181762 RepID=A0ACB8GP69_PSICU|nr:Cytochrome P450 monooxygenase verL [Psilocybe cubensis]KAH9477254.1 Cytochrome P450 monooxygenase verL [Psilocybe cubensis]
MLFVGSILITVSLLLLGAYFLSPIALRRLVRDKDGNTIPPGPPTRYAYLRKYSERALDSWAKQYGDLFSIWMGNQLFVVISDPQVAKDLLVTNGAIFSSRKRYFLKSQVILRGRAITGSPYGEKWRQHRRLASQALSPKSMEDHADIMDYEAHMLIKALYEQSERGTTPLSPAQASVRYALNNMLMLSFGMRTTSIEDPLIAKAMKLNMEFMELSGPWANAIDFFTILQYIPTSKKKRGHQLYADIIDTYGSMILQFKDKMLAGEDVPDCLIKTLLENQETEKLDWEDICMLSAVFTLGGVHSVSVMIQWFIATMISHPDICVKAQQELDRVIGRDRWPTIEDEFNLPYVRAIIKELERVHAPFWNATPHFTTEDFAYKGNYIPKDTVVILNCYTIHHNETRYPDPFSFNPERYLNDGLSSNESSKLSDPMARDHWTFGAGRRICPGIQTAERELWLVCSRLLWSFNFNSIQNEPISLDEYEGFSGRTPKAFRVELTPRFEGVANILDSAEDVPVYL